MAIPDPTSNATTACRAAWRAGGPGRGFARRGAGFLCLLCLAVAASGARAESVEIAHRWGTTEIEGPPERVVSLSYTGVDYFLALGVTPVAYRAWYGGDENGLWPWAAPHLDTADPVVMRGEIDIEAVARLRPDLIEATYSGISQAEYAALSRIAPVLAPPGGVGEFGATWDVMLDLVGRATGRAAQARTVETDLLDRFDRIAAAHPGWAGQSAVVAWPDGPLVYGPDDPRMAVLDRLGFGLPDAARRLNRGGFYFRLDPELTAPLDADVVIWLDVGAGVEVVLDHPLRHTLRIVAEGREIVAEPDLAAALSYASPLSIPFALDRLVPRLEDALDGSARTPVAGAAEAGLAP